MNFEAILRILIDQAAEHQAPSDFGSTGAMDAWLSDFISDVSGAFQTAGYSEAASTLVGEFTSYPDGFVTYTWTEDSTEYSARSTMLPNSDAVVGRF